MSTTIKCQRCAGCGKLADDDDETPWVYWAELPSPSNLAVVMGIVTPHDCPECEGTGLVKRDALGINEPAPPAGKEE